MFQSHRTAVKALQGRSFDFTSRAFTLDLDRRKTVKNSVLLVGFFSEVLSSPERPDCPTRRCIISIYFYSTRLAP